MIRGSMVYIGSPRALKRGMGKVVKESMQEAGALWHRRYLPAHFRGGARAKYGYEQRTKQYQIRKARRKGHQRPLEFTGDLKRSVTRMAQISGTGKQVRVSMSAPWYATRRITGHPDMPKELTSTTRGEVDRLARLVEQLVERKLDQIQTRETRA